MRFLPLLRRVLPRAPGPLSRPCLGSTTPVPGADGRLGQRRLFSQVPGDSAGQGKEEKAQNDKDQDFKGKQAGFRIVDNSKDAAMYLAVLMGLAGFSLYAYYKAKEVMKNENIARKSGNVAPTERKTTASQIQIGGNFQLVDQEGNTRKLTEFRGKYVVLYFGFANCPDYCPTELKKLSQALENLEKLLLGEIQLIFISVDPARDTPAVLKKFAEPYNKNAVYLTGTKEQIAQVAKDYRVYFFIPETDDEYYQVDHSLYTYFLDKTGKVQGFLSNTLSAESVEKIIMYFHRTGEFRTDL